MPNCSKHPHVKLVCPACLGARNAGVSSPQKAKSSRKNGRLGGRPRKLRDEPNES